MEVIPALDLRAGRVVRLGVHGDFGTERAHGDPVARAISYAADGARRLHVVDLDAASGSGDNRAAVGAVVESARVAVQVAGGIRDVAAVDRWISAGADAAVMGTAAVRSPELLRTAAERHPGRVIAALDLREGRAAVAAWTEVDARSLDELLAAWDAAPLRSIVLTSVDRDGSLAGPDLDALKRVRSLTRHPIVYSGGVGSLDDLDRLAAAGASGAILGRALLEGHFALAEALERCAAIS